VLDILRWEPGDERGSSFRKDLFSQVASSPPFNTVQQMVDSVTCEHDKISKCRANALIGTVEGNVYRWVLVNVPESKPRFHNQLFRLET